MERDLFYITKETHAVLVHVTTNLYMSEVRTLELFLKKEGVGVGRETVVFNLEEVEQMDSSGLGFLISFHKALKKRGGKLRVVVSSEEIRRLLELTGSDTILEIYTTIDTAKEDLR